MKDLVNFKLNFQIHQRKLVGLGKAISRIISMDQVLNLAHKGYRIDLIEGGISMLQQDISELMAGFTFKDKSVLADGYQENSSWSNFI